MLEIKNLIYQFYIVLVPTQQNYWSKFESINFKKIQFKNWILWPFFGYRSFFAAVAMGAKIIEKHITLNKNQYGPDQKASIEPNEFKIW